MASKRVQSIASAKAKPKKVDLPALVDELGEIEAQLSGVDVLIRKKDDIRKRIRIELGDRPAEETITIEGKHSIALVSEQTLETVVDNRGAMRAMGQAKFLEACKITLKALEALPEDQRIALTHKERIGPRTIKVFARYPKAVAA